MKPKRLMTRSEKQFLRRLNKKESDGWTEFFSRRDVVQTRMALTLLRRGLLCIAVTKWSFFGTSPFPWKEIAVAVDPKRLSHYPVKVPAAVKIRARRR